MRRLVARAVAGVAVAASVGCRTQSCCEGPIVRQDYLPERSEDSSPDGERWRRGADLMGEQPSHMKRERIKGGIL